MESGQLRQKAVMRYQELSHYDSESIGLDSRKEAQEEFLYSIFQKQSSRNEISLEKMRKIVNMRKNYGSSKLVMNS